MFEVLSQIRITISASNRRNFRDHAHDSISLAPWRINSFGSLRFLSKSIALLGQAT